MKKVLAMLMVMVLTMCMLTGCGEVDTSGTEADIAHQQSAAANLAESQPTPTDIDYSLERYNLIRRTYWVNGQREKAMSLPCPVARPLGYIVLMLEGVGIVGTYVVDGKVSSLNSFLTPDSEYYEVVYGGTYTEYNNWLADVDGSYGENDNGIFFFTTDGNYIEWTGTCLYSDIPFIVDEPILKTQEVE